MLQSHARYHDVVRWLLTSRRSRSDLFDRRAFGEPAWDILLVLYEAELHSRSLTLSEVSRRSGIPSTSLTRWIDTLLGWELISRCDDQFDRRATRIALTPAARTKLERYVEVLLASAPAGTCRDETPPA